MDKRSKKIIENHAFDCTVGAGFDGRVSKEHLAGLKRALSRDITDEDVAEFRRAWEANIQCMAQP